MCSLALSRKVWLTILHFMLFNHMAITYWCTAGFSMDYSHISAYKRNKWFKYLSEKRDSTHKQLVSPANDWIEMSHFPRRKSVKKHEEFCRIIKCKVP